MRAEETFHAHRLARAELIELFPCQPHDHVVHEVGPHGEQLRAGDIPLVELDGLRRDQLAALMQLAKRIRPRERLAPTTLACNLRKFLRASPRTTTGSLHLPHGTRDWPRCGLGPVGAPERFLSRNVFNSSRKVAT